MGKSRISEGEALEQLRREQDPGGGRFVDMRIDIEFGGELVMSVGGLWDRRLEDFDGDAETGILIEPHEGEMEAILWFKEWLGVHGGRRDDPPAPESDDELGNQATDPAEVYSALLAGGRRGGKTWSGALFCAMYAVHFPNAIVWAINPSDSDHDEVRRYMSRFLAPEWIQRETAADGWELVNGSAIMLKSAYVGADPDAIKKGEVNLAWMNEGQKMAHRVYVVARGAIADHSGLVLVCANPPVQKKDQQWVGDFAADAQANRRASVYHHFHPLKNPHINRQALLSMRRELDERAFRIEVLGEFLGPEDAVAYNWLRTAGGNERPAPLPDDPVWEDVTTEFLRAEEEGEGFTCLIGLDVQVHPHIGGPVLKFFAPRDQEPTRENVVVWGVDEVVLDGADEEGFTAELRHRKFDPDETLIVCDATGEYQHSRRRSSDSPPPEWKGKGSFDIIRMGGYRHIVPPSRRMRRKNPDVIDRVRSFTSMIEVYATRTRRLFLDPDRCPKTCKSIREWPTAHGKPSRVHEAAHLGDALSYPIIRLFPRILRSGKPGGVDPVTQRVDRPESLASLLGQPSSSRPRRGRGQGL